LRQGDGLCVRVNTVDRGSAADFHVFLRKVGRLVEKPCCLLVLVCLYSNVSSISDKPTVRP
jgi:hypothetical protein